MNLEVSHNQFCMRRELIFVIIYLSDKNRTWSAEHIVDADKNSVDVLTYLQPQ